MERKTRYVVLVALPAGRSAELVRDALVERILTLPEQLRQSLTWDRGKMAEHVRFTVETGVQVYFCDLRCPQGLKGAIAAVLLDAAWQRCRVHFLAQRARPHPAVSEQLDEIVDKLRPRFPVVAAMLTEAKEDVTAFAAFPMGHWKKIWSTNPLERVNKEVPVFDWCMPEGPRRRLLRWVTVPRPDSKEISDATSIWWPSSV